MGQLQISPSTLDGTLTIPPSKSHTMRAILFASLATGISEIDHVLHSSDTEAMISAMRSFGAEIEVAPFRLRIRGIGGKWEGKRRCIDAKNSGIVLRFVGAISALFPSPTVITGDHSICHRRPVQPLLEGLRQLGAFATSCNRTGYAPIQIQGPMQPGKVCVLGQDSQPVSGLLIATSFLPGKTLLEVKDPGETPWIDLTLFWLKRCGIQITHEEYRRYTIEGEGSIEGFSCAIPGDLSSLAFPFAAALVTGSSITLNNVDLSDCQGDKVLIAIAEQMGARIEIDPKGQQLTVRKSTLHGVTIDANGCIDAVPILAVLGCFAEGKTEITNVAIARNKESDRLHAIALELKKMGGNIEEKSDGLVITHSPLRGACLFSHYDHRIAMALAVAALGAKGDSLIVGVECIAKTYPDFAQALCRLGANLFHLNLKMF